MLTSSGAGRNLGSPVVEWSTLQISRQVSRPTEIGERERPHRVIEAKPDRGVDVADIGDALAERKGRLVEHRHEDAIDDEAGRIESMHDLLAERLGEGVHRRDRCVGCAEGRE